MFCGHLLHVNDISILKCTQKREFFQSLGYANSRTLGNFNPLFMQIIEKWKSNFEFVY